MDYDKLPVILKRYSFEAKMSICQQFSNKLISLDGKIDYEKFIKGIMPWELETFALFSIIAKNEYREENFNGSNIRKFSEIINCFRNYQPPKLLGISKEKFIERIIMISGLTQFSAQEFYVYKLFRYSYFFEFHNDKIDMQSIFLRKFGCSYEEFKRLAFTYYLLFSNSEIKTNVMDYVLYKYAAAFNQLVITREDFIEKQSIITNSIEDYMYGFRLFYQFPFIEYDRKAYIPLPHILIDATTSSLLYRLTEGDNGLRKRIGKEVIESYLFHILSTSEIYTETIGERKYTVRGAEERTPDVMCRYNNLCLLLDSKSIVPFVKTREMDESFINRTVDRIASSVVQMYKFIDEKFQKWIYPFEYKTCFAKDHVFGIVVLLEDSYILRDKIFVEAAQRLSIETNSDDYNYLCSNIKVFGLYEIENRTFSNDNLLELLSSNRNKKDKHFDLTLFSNEPFFVQRRKPSKIVDVFIEKEKSAFIELSKELVLKGLIEKG